MFGLAELPEQLCFTVFLSFLFELEALCITVSSWLAHYECSVLFALYSLESNVSMYALELNSFLLFYFNNTERISAAAAATTGN